MRGAGKLPENAAVDQLLETPINGDRPNPVVATPCPISDAFWAFQALSCPKYRRKLVTLQITLCGNDAVLAGN
jgi:hypothetical protein